MPARGPDLEEKERDFNEAVKRASACRNWNIPVYHAGSQRCKMRMDRGSRWGHLDGDTVDILSSMFHPVGISHIDFERKEVAYAS